MPAASTQRLPVSERALVFECGSEDLVGVLHVSGGTLPELGVVFVVGGPQYRVGSHRQFVAMAREVAKQGYPVLRFDYRGMGDSGGATRTFEDAAPDIRRAVDTLLAEVPSIRGVVLWGLCDAASASLMYAAGDGRVAGLLLANPWVRTVQGEARSYLRHYYWQRLLQRSFWSKVLSGKFSVGKSARDLGTALQRAGDNAAGGGPAQHFIARMLAGLRAFDRPIQVLISERDLTAQEFVDRCRTDGGWRQAMARPNVRVLDLPGADHTFSSRGDLTAATEATVALLERVVAGGAAGSDRPLLRTSEGR
jgi:exosortase A-associated hydrolase 1